MTTQIGNTNIDSNEIADQHAEPDLIFHLENPPCVAPVGNNAGRFIRPEMFERKIDETEKRRILKVSVQLDAQDDDGKPFVLSREYNLSGHGLTAFKEDIKAWRGTALTRDERRDFNASRLVINKPVVVVVAHREIGNKTVAYIKSFQPAAAPVVAS